jgi:hypothetical protein
MEHAKSSNEGKTIKGPPQVSIISDLQDPSRKYREISVGCIVPILA